jgi:uncharacterized protein YciI
MCGYKERVSLMKKHFVVFLQMLDEEKNAEHRQAHLDYLEARWNEGVLSAYGRFPDGWGGMLVFHAESEEQVKEWAENDPYVIQKARTYEVHEWALAKANVQV